MNSTAVVWDLNGVIYKNFRLDLNTLGIIKRLSKHGFVQYVCTNTNKSRMNEVETVLTKYGYFKDIYANVDLGFLKPDIRIYEYLKSNIAQEEILFIDDSPKNVSVAIEKGMYGIRYISDEQLIEDLKFFNIFNDN